MEEDRVLMRGTRSASPKATPARDGDRVLMRCPDVVSPKTCACHGCGSRPARRASHRGACDTDAPVRERGAEHPRVVDRLDRGDFGEEEARAGTST